MKVIQNKPKAWFFLKHNNDFYINVNCNISVFGFSMLVKLNDEELNRFIEKGYTYIDSLANQIQNSSQSKYKSRQTLGKIGQLSHEAILKFNTNK